MKRRILSLVIVMAMIMSLMPVIARAATSGTCGENLTWTLDDNGTLTISGIGAMEDYDYSNHSPWYSNHSPWYSKKSSIKTVDIKDGVTTIGDDAFYKCTSLTSVTIGNSVTIIGESAFEDCTSLTSVDIPDSVTTIEWYTFYDCDSLTSVDIPDRVTSIGGYAFYDCDSLTSVDIPDSVTTIAWYTFAGCDSLTSVDIPDSVTSIGDATFSSCNSLTSINVNSNNKNYSSVDGVLFNKSKTEILCYPGDISGAYIIPNSVTKIGNSAFAGCSSLTSVDIPDSVTSIGYEAFRSCDSLTSVTIGNSVTSIGDWAFAYCDSLTSVTIPNSVTTIGDSAFRGCNSLTSVDIPDSVTTIGMYTFYDCDSLTSVTIGNSVTIIGESAFSGCSSLTSVVIPDSVTEIREFAFYSCDDLTSIKIPNSVTTIERYTFYDCDSLTSVDIPDSVTSIGNHAFYDCNSLTSVTIPDSVTEIGNQTFYNCSSLTDVYYGGSEEEWKAIDIYSGNGRLTGATIHYNSLGEDEPIPTPEPIVTPKPIPTPTPKPIVTPAPTVDVDNNYTGGNELIDKAEIDAENLLSNITVGTDSIKGPKISILGNDFYLFDIDGTCTFELEGVEIELSVDEEKNSIKLLGGYDFIDESVSTGSDYTNRGEWTKSYNELKSLYNALTGGNFDDKTARSKFSSVYNKLKQSDSNLFLNIKGNFALYGELTYNNGQWTMTEGGGILKASAGGSIDPRIGGIFYGTFGISVDASGNFAVKYNTENKGLDVSTKLNITPEVNLGIGAGEKKVLCIEGGLKGKLPIDIFAATGSFNTGNGDIVPLKVMAQGYIYVKGKALVLEAEMEWQLGDDIVLYPSDGDVSLSSIEDTFTLDIDDFKMIPRDYLNNISLMSLDDVFEKSSLYPYSTPKLTELSDGRKLLLWIDDDTSKADADRTSMYYSIYTPFDSSWTEPQIAVVNDGYNDLMRVCTDGENVYIVWSYIDEALGDNAEIDDMTSRMNLYYTIFDGEAFAAPQIVSNSNNGLGEMLYSISEDNETVSIAWVENSANDITLSEGTNIVYKRTLSDGVWSDIETVGEITGEIHDVQVADNGSVVYETSNENITKLYVDGVEIGETENSNSSFKIIDNEIYYLSKDILNTYNIESGETVSENIGEITDITIIKDGDRKIALTLLSTGFTNELYQNEYIDGKWGEWTQLTEYNKYIRDYSAVIDNGSLSVALNLVDVEDEEKGGYGNATLKVISDMEYSDIILDDAPYYDGEVKENEKVDIYFNVTNNSRNDINNLNAKITDKNGTVMYSGGIKCDIKAGQTQLLSAPVTIPEGFEKQDLTITVEGDFEENNIENNTATVTVGYIDIALQNVALTKNGNKVTLRGSVNNIGFENGENVTVKIYDSDINGTLWQTINLGQIISGESKDFDFELLEQYMTSSEAKKAVYIEVSTESNEYEIGNNSDRVVFADLSDLESIDDVTMSYDEGMLTVKTPKALGADFMAAYYDNSGSLIDCRRIEIALGVGTNNIAIEGLTTGANVKFMLWDKNMQPLCDYLTWE